jgi:hypothetical protein
MAFSLIEFSRALHEAAKAGSRARLAFELMPIWATDAERREVDEYVAALTDEEVTDVLRALWESKCHAVLQGP